MSRSPLVLPALLFLLVLAAACSSDPSGPEPSAVPSSGPPVSESDASGAAPLPTNGIVACFYEEARAAGVSVLEEGGSAADAFVAITLVDYVRAAGETSLGGPLGALTYDGKTGKVESLDATFDSVGDPSGLYDPNAPALGASVLVPGALWGLEALWKEKGRLTWPRLVAPAKELAAKGYAADALLVGQIQSRREVLERSAYAKALYLPSGSPIAIGTIVKQPEVAAFLDDVASQGADAMYGPGAWADGFVGEIAANGGKASRADLTRYEAKWQEPWSLHVGDGDGGKEVFTNSGRAYGGVYDLVGLSVLAHDSRDPTTLSDADRLEARLRTARALYEDPWFFTASNLDDAAVVKGRIADTDALWAKVVAQSQSMPKVAKGSHSLEVTVIDRDGNAVTGTNTINALAWGSGIFVRGVALTDAGTATMFVPGPAQRVVTPLTLHVVKSAGHLHFIGGAFGSSLLETELQIVADAALGRATTARDVVARPRFGTFPFDFAHPTAGSDFTANWLTRTAPDALAAELETRGLHVKRDPYGDTGWGTFVLREPSGALVAGTLDDEWFRAGVVELAK
jgi:gamma-glutamyltranspeptidase/glutathione hydrolase